MHWVSASTKTRSKNSSSAVTRSPSRRAAVTSGELQTGARGLAAPVRGVDGLRASVGVVTLDGAIDEDVVAPQVIAAAAAVAERLR